MHLAHVAEKYGSCDLSRIVANPETYTPECVARKSWRRSRAHAEGHAGAAAVRALGWDGNRLSGRL